LEFEGECAEGLLVESGGRGEYVLLVLVIIHDSEFVLALKLQTGGTSPSDPH
jgi:hypothetical protein